MCSRVGPGLRPGPAEQSSAVSSFEKGVTLAVPPKLELIFNNQFRTAVSPDSRPPDAESAKARIESNEESS